MPGAHERPPPVVARPQVAGVVGGESEVPRGYETTGRGIFGSYRDAQTGNPRSYFYGSSGDVLLSFTPDGDNHQVDWTPVYAIRNC